MEQLLNLLQVESTDHCLNQKHQYYCCYWWL